MAAGEIGASWPEGKVPFFERERVEAIAGVFEFNRRLSWANEVVRFKNTPAMEQAIQGEGGPGRESIGSHMWGARVLWETLQKACPALAAIVNGDRVAAMLGMHDMGEIGAGDVSRILTEQGIAPDKHLEERRSLEELVASLTPELRDYYLDLFDEFENTNPTTRTIEADVAKMIDALHGDMHNFNYAQMTSDDYVAAARRVIFKYTRPTFIALLEFCERAGNKAAFDDVMNIIQAYCDFVNNHDNPGIAGLRFDPEELVAE